MARHPFGFWKPASVDFPSTLALTSWFRDYAGSVWSGTASAGTSGSRTLTEATNAPGIGSKNGHGIAQFDGTNDTLTMDVNNNTLFSGSAGFWCCLWRADTAFANNNGTYQDGTLFTDPSNAETTFGVTHTTGIVSACVLDSSVTYHAVSAAAASLNVWYCTMAYWTATQLEIEYATGSTTTDNTFSTYTPIVSSQPVIGRSYAGAYFRGDVAEIMTGAFTPNGTQRANIRSYLSARWAVTV